MESFQTRLHRQLEPTAWPGDGVSVINKLVLALVSLSLLVAIFETEPYIKTAAPDTLLALKAFFAVTFTFEYIMRLWAAGAMPQYAGLSGKWRYFWTPISALDFTAAAFLWIEILSPIHGTLGVLFRLARILRIFSLVRNSKWSRALRLMGSAIKARYIELILSLCLAIIALSLSATALYLVEKDIQPDAFGSVPRSMWWAVATLTTVGYGDVYPITAAGKVIAGLSSLTAIAIVGIPAGIMAAAFSDAFQNFRNQDSAAQK